MFDSEGRNAKCAGRSLRAVPATCQGTEAGDASPSTPIKRTDGVHLSTPN
jgi:hypothetical protein